MNNSLEIAQRNTLLIIEDDATNLKVLVGYLETYEFELLIARNGESGFEKAKIGEPDLILLDIQMPGIDGFETCRRLKADKTTHSIPIIFMTALSSIKDKVKGLQLGAVDYITKPFDQTEVLARINTHLTLRHLQQQLQQANDELEERVADRTHRLQVRARLSQQMNQIHQLDDLLTFVVTELKTNFAYAQVQVYLLDDDPHLGLTREIDIPGQALKGATHQLFGSENIILDMLQSNEDIVVNDLASDSEFLLTTDLPTVRSLLVIPLSVGDDPVMGSLNVYGETAGFFTAKEVSMLRSIASELASTLTNIRLQSEREATILELQALDKAKSQFLAVISHELRTPMNVILGYIELLTMGGVEPLSDPVKKMLDSAYERGLDLSTMIDTMLDITKMEMGQLAVSLETVNVQAVFSKLVFRLQADIGDKPLSILIETPSDLPPVLADPTRLNQILSNLGDNALKFTQHGTVIFKAEEDPDQAEKVRFAVIDTGVGIPEDQLVVIFDLFKLADMSITRTHGGLGIGLAIAERLVKLQGGQLQVKSTVKQGSEFFFSLPKV